MALSGVRGANQFQNYLDRAPGCRARGRRPFWHRHCPIIEQRSIPVSTRKAAENTVPTEERIATFEQTQALITEKYFAYFTEKDPKKRAELLRSFNRARSQVTRALSARGAKSERLLDAVSSRRTRLATARRDRPPD